MALSKRERQQLAATFGCQPADVSAELRKYAGAANEEYVRMILGQRVFTRGQDIREWRLYLIIQHVFGGRLPSEGAISGLFQTTTTQSRALLRAVMSKYQYELQVGIRATLLDVLRRARQDPTTTVWSFTIDSENVVDALNREIVDLDGTLPQVSKARGTVSTYEIPNSSYERLADRFQ